MTGPEHYREAERLLAVPSSISQENIAALQQRAQVHATLALTAAFALRDDSREWSAWCKVASKPVDGGQ